MISFLYILFFIYAFSCFYVAAYTWNSWLKRRKKQHVPWLDHAIWILAALLPVINTILAVWLIEDYMKRKME